jgi:hypothetical protein
MTYETENDAEAAEEAVFIETVFDGSDDPGNGNASRVKAGAEVFSKVDASAEASEPNNSTELLGNASENALTMAEITVFTSDARTLSKRYELGADGRLVKDGSTCAMSSGLARRCDASTAEKLAAIINKCELPNAVCVGRFTNPAVQKTRIVTAGREADGEISRTKEYFDFVDGPGWALLDADGTGDADVSVMFCGVIPELVTTARVLRPSTSFGLSSALTEESFPASGGMHILLLLKDQRDLPRFLEDLHKRLWLAGHGWIKVTADGKALERSPVDTALKDPTRLIFEGGPDLGPGLVQAARPAVAYDGEALDSLLACPPLAEAEAREYDRLVADAKARKQPECDRVRTSWEAVHVKARVAKGMSEADARGAVSRIADGGELDPLFGLHFDRLGAVTVADVLADPKKYVGQPMADPIEGVAYGRGTARLYQHPAGELWVNSFAHGGCRYTLPLPVRPSLETTFDDVEQATVARIAAQAKAESVAEPGENPAGGINFRDAQVKRAPYVMKGWLHRGETVQWFGPPGAGKSASLLSVMLAAAAAPPEGAMLAGCRVKRGLAIFAAYERAGETQDRLAAARKRLSLPEDLPFVLLTRPPLLKDGKAVESVIETIRHYEKLHGMPCSMYAVDTLTAARPGMGQSDDAEMSSLMNHLQRIRDTVGCCLPFIHHPTKANANNPGGSGVTTGHVDKEVVVNKGRLRMQKNNAGPDADALDLKIESVLMGEDDDGDPISVAYASVKPSRVSVGKAFGGVDDDESSYVPAGLRQAYDALKSVAAGRPDGVVSTNDWFDQIDADAKTARLKKPVRATKNNHQDALVDGGFIASDGMGFWRLK